MRSYILKGHLVKEVKKSVPWCFCFLCLSLPWNSSHSLSSCPLPFTWEQGQGSMHTKQACYLPASPALLSLSICPFHDSLYLLQKYISTLPCHGGSIATVKLDYPGDESLSEGVENGNAFQLLKASDHGTVWWQLSLHVSLVVGDNSSTSVIPLWFVHWLLKRVKVAIFW